MECVYIVDDEAMIRRLLKRAFDHAGMATKTFENGRELLAALDTLPAGVILLDIRMPEMDGLQVLEAMRHLTRVHAVLMLSSHGDISTAVQAMNLGAVDFVEKPFSTAKLLDRIREMQQMIRQWQGQDEIAESAKARIDVLSDRERQVGQELVEGLSNKEIARKLGISPRTVETHRAQLMRKLGASSLADVVRIFVAGRA